MERWDSIGSTELMQQLYPVYHEWVLFLVTTLKYCVFVCLHRCAYCSIYTHTDGYHSLRWCSKYALFVYVNNACFFFLFFGFDSASFEPKFISSFYLNVYHAGIFQMSSGWWGAAEVVVWDSVQKASWIHKVWQDNDCGWRKISLW